MIKMTKEEKIRAVRKLVDKLAKSRTISFFPDCVVKQIPGLTHQEAVKYLTDLTKYENILEIKWQVICPNERCGSKNLIYDTLKEIPEQIECKICGYEMEDAADYALMVFVFNAEYKNRRQMNSWLSDLRR